MKNHSQWMQKALAAAQIRRGFCAPNPSVGAVLVSPLGECLGTGTHWACGHDHAERNVIQKVGVLPPETTLYVTLEPCSHHGRTPPCTDIIIDSGVSSVYYAYKDPNPQVSGSGADVLSRAGIACHHLPLPAVDNYYKSYAYWLKTKHPRLIAKLAQSQDGITARADGAPLTITGKEAASLTAQKRQQADALLTTIQTVIKDNPRLNCRTADCVISKRVYVMDSSLQFPPDARLLETAEEVVLLYSSSNHTTKLNKEWPLSDLRGIPIASGEWSLEWLSISEALGKEGLHEVWFEGGPTAFQSLLNSGLMAEAWIYQSPHALGAGLPGISFTHERLVSASYTESDVGEDSAFHFEWF